MKKVFFFTKLLNIFIFIIIFAAMSAVLLFFPRTTDSDYDKELKKFPGLTAETFFSGEYFKGVSDYITDTVYKRDTVKEWASLLTEYYGLEEEIYFYGDIPEPQENSVPEENSRSGNESVPPADISEPVNDDSVPDTSGLEESAPEELEIAAGRIVYGTRAMELYGNSPAGNKKYAEYVSKYAELLPGVNVYSLVVPKSCVYYLRNVKGYENFHLGTLNDLSIIKDNLTGGAVYIDVYEKLLAHTGEDIFFRTDFHWTALGAYYACEAFAEKADIYFPALDSYEKTVREGFLGRMYTLDKNPKLLKNPDDFVTYKNVSVSNIATFYDTNMQNPRSHDIFWYLNDQQLHEWYSTFINGDKTIVKYVSETCANGRKLVIYKDSYGNATAPYFLESFEEVYIFDLRFSTVNSINFIKDNGITDVLFATSINSSAVSSINKKIQDMMNY